MFQIRLRAGCFIYLVLHERQWDKKCKVMGTTIYDNVSAEIYFFSHTFYALAIHTIQFLEKSSRTYRYRSIKVNTIAALFTRNMSL